MYWKNIFKLNKVLSRTFQIKSTSYGETKCQGNLGIGSNEGCQPVRKLLLDPICKVAIVTGGSTAIGQGTANALLEAGCRHVVITGVTSPGLEKSGEKTADQLSSRYGNNRCSYHEADILNDHQLETLFTDTRAAYGIPDIVFNNVQYMSDRHWRTSVQLNIGGLIRNTLTALKHMRGGVIVNNAGLAFYPLPTAPIYSGLCHSALYFSIALGDEYNLHQTGVRVVGLGSGPFQSKQLVLAEQLTKRTTQDHKLKFEKMPNLMRSQTIGNAVVHLVKYAPSGTGWLIDDGFLYRIPNLTKKNFEMVTGFPP